MGNPEAGTTLLRGGLVAGSDGQFERLDIGVRGNIIEFVGDLDSIQFERVLDASNRLVLPGIVNSHYHSNEIYLRGSFCGLPLEHWLPRSIMRQMATSPAPEDIYLRTLYAGTELLRGGSTTVIDFLYVRPSVSLASIQPVVDGYRDAGIRATILLAVSDLSMAESLEFGVADLAGRSLEVATRAQPDTAAWLELCEAAVDAWHDDADGRIRIGIAPDAPHRCSDQLLVGLVELAEAKGLAVQTHCLQSRVEAMIGRRRYGRGVVEHLAEIGFLDGAVSLAHAIWLTDREVEVVGENESVSVVHAPISNLKVGGGLAPIPELVGAGVNVALGSDGIANNDSHDAFETVKLAALLHTVRTGDFRSWIPPAKIWDMATSGGARCAGLETSIGKIQPGFRADLLLLDTDDSAFVPLGDPMNNLVFAGGGHAIREVMVDGRLVIRDGWPVGVDFDDLKTEIRQRGLRFEEAYAEVDGEAEILARTIGTIYRDAEDEDLGVDRRA